MTPEQLADYCESLAKEIDHTHFTHDLIASAAELRRLAVENEALRAESMRFRADAMNEKAARKAIEAALAERQGEAVALFLLHSGQIDSGGEQDQWDAEADSGAAVDEFCRKYPGQTIKLYAGPEPTHQAPAPAQQQGEADFIAATAERNQAIKDCIAQIEKIDDCDSPAYRHCQEEIQKLMKPPPAQQPLTDEQIQDLLGIGNPTEEECRLIRLGWNAAHGIGGEKP